jgi:hypothetical protein
MAPSVFPPDTQRHPGSYVDPAGCLFESEGRILRGISSSFVDFYRSLLEHSAVRDLLKSSIVATTVFDGPLGDYTFVLEHFRVEGVSYCNEWPAQMLKDAGLLTLDICLGCNAVSPDRSYAALRGNFQLSRYLDSSKGLFDMVHDTEEKHDLMGKIASADLERALDEFARRENITMGSNDAVMSPYAEKH